MVWSLFDLSSPVLLAVLDLISAFLEPGTPAYLLAES